MRKLSLLISIILVLQSCATIFIGKKDNFKVEKGIPKNAIVLINNDTLGIAPIKLKLPMNELSKINNIELQVSGYKTDTFTIERKIRTGYFVANFFTLGIGYAIDFNNGNIFKPVPSKIDYKLENLHDKVGEFLVETIIEDTEFVRREVWELANWGWRPCYTCCAEHNSKTFTIKVEPPFFIKNPSIRFYKEKYPAHTQPVFEKCQSAHVALIDSLTFNAYTDEWLHYGAYWQASADLYKSNVKRKKTLQKPIYIGKEFNVSIPNKSTQVLVSGFTFNEGLFEFNAKEFNGNNIFKKLRTESTEDGIKVYYVFNNK